MSFKQSLFFTYFRDFILIMEIYNSPYYDVEAPEGRSIKTLLYIELEPDVSVFSQRVENLLAEVPVLNPMIDSALESISYLSQILDEFSSEQFLWIKIFVFLSK